MSDPQHADMLAAWNEPRHGANQCEHGHHYRACPFCERDREIADLRIELANLRAADIHSCGPTCTRAGCVNDSLRAQVAALEGDAGRYRWLRQQNCILDSGRSGIFTAIRMTEADGGFSHNDLIAMEGMDAAIDAALAARKGG